VRPVHLPFDLDSLPSPRASFVRNPRGLAAAVALAATAIGFGGAGCTETPDYFPPCVENAPCEAPDSAADAAEAGSVSDAAAPSDGSGPADAAPETAPGDP